MTDAASCTKSSEAPNTDIGPGKADPKLQLTDA